MFSFALLDEPLSKLNDCVIFNSYWHVYGMLNVTLLFFIDCLVVSSEWSLKLTLVLLVLGALGTLGTWYSSTAISKNEQLLWHIFSKTLQCIWIHKILFPSCYLLCLCLPVFETLFISVCAAVKAYGRLLIGRQLEEIYKNFGAFWQELVHEPQLRWVRMYTVIWLLSWFEWTK